MYPGEDSNYERSIPITRQDQGPAVRYPAGPTYQPYPYGPVSASQGRPAKNGNQKPKPAIRMPKVQALALVEKMKKGIIVVSLLMFGTFSALVGYRQTVTAAVKTASNTASSTTPTATATQDSSNGYFNQGSSTSINNGSNSASSSSTNSNSGSTASTPTSTTTAPGTSTSVS